MLILCVECGSKGHRQFFSLFVDLFNFINVVVISPADSCEHISLRMNVFSVTAYELSATLDSLLTIANGPNYLMKTRQTS